LHTHLAATEGEEEYCLRRFGARPLDYMARLGWLDADVWYAQATRLDDIEVRRIGGAGAGVAHCPSADGRLAATGWRVVDLAAADVPVGLGTGDAPEAGGLVGELRHAVFQAR